MIYRSPSVGQMVEYDDGRVVIGGGSSFVDLRDPRRRLGCLSVKHSAKPGSQDCQGVLTVESQSVSLDRVMVVWFVMVWWNAQEKDEDA